MSEIKLSREERLCVQMWFRQAIAQLEQERATRSLVRWLEEDVEAGHRAQVSRRRARHSVRGNHAREAVSL